MGLERPRLIGGEEELPLQEDRSIKDFLPGLAHPLDRGEEGNGVDFGEYLFQNLCGRQRFFSCGPMLVWTSRVWARHIDERGILGKLYQHTEGAYTSRHSEANWERPPGGVVNVRFRSKPGGIKMGVIRVQDGKGMFKGSNIKGRFVARRGIEKERYRRVRPSVMVFFINLVDCFHHESWWSIWNSIST